MLHVDVDVGIAVEAGGYPNHPAVVGCDAGGSDHGHVPGIAWSCIGQLQLPTSVTVGMNERVLNTVPNYNVLFTLRQNSSDYGHGNFWGWLSGSSPISG